MSPNHCWLLYDFWPCPIDISIQDDIQGNIQEDIQDNIQDDTQDIEDMGFQGGI